MPTLSASELKIDLVSGTLKRKVTAKVTVKFDTFEENQIKAGLKFRLRCRIWGWDGFGPIAIIPTLPALSWPDDDVKFSFPSKIITADGTYPFSTVMNSSALDEDPGSNVDEVYAKFTCKSTTQGFPLEATPLNSPGIVGIF